MSTQYQDCPGCGQPAQAGAAFCPHCGQQHVVQSVAATQAARPTDGG